MNSDSPGAAEVKRLRRDERQNVKLITNSVEYINFRVFKKNIDTLT